MQSWCLVHFLVLGGDVDGGAGYELQALSAGGFLGEVAIEHKDREVKSLWEHTQSMVDIDKPINKYSAHLIGEGQV
jgi:hypothetical protein